MSSSNCCFLTCIQISQEASHVVWYSHLLKNFPQSVVIHTVKGFGIVNKAKVDVFLELSYFFDDLTDVGNLISGSSAFSISSLNIWKFTVHILLKPGLENFEYYFASMWDECSFAVVWTLFGIASYGKTKWNLWPTQFHLVIYIYYILYIYFFSLFQVFTRYWISFSVLYSRSLLFVFLYVVSLYMLIPKS